MNDPSNAYQELIEENAILKQRIQEMHESESGYKMLFTSAAEGILVAELQTKQFIYANPALCKMFGYKEEEVLQLGVEDIHPKESLKHVMAEFDALARGEKTCALNIPCLHKDGSLFYTNISTASIVVLDGVKCNVGFFTDITERKQAEEALRENEKKYRIIAENTADQIAILDMNLHFTYVSPNIMRLRGLTVDEAMAQTLEQVLTPESMRLGLSVFEEEMQLEISGEADPDRTRILEVEEYKKDGSTVWVEVNFSFLRDNDRKPVEIVMVSRDITERKRAKKALQSEHIMLARTEGIVHIGSWEWDIATDTVIWSDELFRIFQRDPREGAPSFAEHPAFYHPDDMARLRQPSRPPSPMEPLTNLNFGPFGKTVRHGCVWHVELPNSGWTGVRSVCLAHFKTSPTASRRKKSCGRASNVSKRHRRWLT
jgi:PAS domain S-box-containing protein